MEFEKLLVAATAVSGPASVASRSSAVRASGLSGLSVTATVRDPAADSASVSARMSRLWPDWLIASVTVPRACRSRPQIECSDGPTEATGSPSAWPMT